MKLKIQPQNVEIEIDPNKTVYQMCVENQIPIRSLCKGAATCAECRVRVTEGDHNVLPPSKQELNMIGTSYYLDGRRLSCQLRFFGNVTVDLSEHLERGEQQNKKIRGFKSAHRQQESHAKKDTFMLQDKDTNSGKGSQGGRS